MKLRLNHSLKVAIGTLIGIGALVLVATFPGDRVRASTFGPLAISQPACTCASTPLGPVANGRMIYNCQCGSLQCVLTAVEAAPNVVGSSNAAMVCSK